MNMKFYDLLLIAFVLSLDAFAVSINCGLKLKSVRLQKYFKISLSFAFFQTILPLLGWLIGFHVKDFIAGYAYIIAFVIFTILGAKTIIESLRKSYEKASFCDCASLKCLLGLSVATSIDAFVLGLVLAFSNSSLILILALIFFITFILSITGCYLGNFMGGFLKNKAIFLSGLILLALAIKVLFEGLTKPV